MFRQKRPAPGDVILGFMGRLRRDVRGNVLAMMAAMLIPLAGLSGSAIDMARLYSVKSRLQQACDAGVLAGRKFMADSSSTALDATAAEQAQAFFKNNFKPGWYSTTSTVFTPTKTSDNQVAGVASANVAMTIMAMFGQTSRTVTVNCQARFDVADTDVIFVLDTTGSMACLPGDSTNDCNNYVGDKLTNRQVVSYTRPNDSVLGASSGSVNNSVPGYPGSTGYYVPEKSGSRISALRTAVINFYKTMDASADPSTHIRYGFVTYTSAVNAGKAVMEMSPSYMVGGSGNAMTRWNYQTRWPSGDYTASATTTTVNVNRRSECDAKQMDRTPAIGETFSASGQSQSLFTYDDSGKATEVVVNEYKRQDNGQRTCKYTTYVYTPKWTYEEHQWDVRNFLTSATVDDPTRVNNTTLRWEGCVEERDTTAGVASFDITNLPPDLDPDLIPTVNDPGGKTSWRPMIPGLIHGRNWYPPYLDYYDRGVTTSDGDPTTAQNGTLAGFGYLDWTRTANGTSYPNYMQQAGYTVCGKPVRRLAVMSLQDVTNYVNANDFRAIGGTYHDTGMIWGVRMLSRNGIFKSDNQAWAGRQPPNRVIVFLTDGDMTPNDNIYGMYGIEYFEGRVANGNSSPSLKDYHNARFLAECAKAKAMNISVWTVSIASSATTEMQQCASTTAQALSTTDGGGLSTAFNTIAKQVAMLRISK